MPRLARLDDPGTLHHVIIRGIEKRRIVDDGREFGEGNGEGICPWGMGGFGGLTISWSGS